MSEIKNSLEAFGTLTTENLQRATVSRNIEDIFAARIYAQAKIQGLVENGAKTFSERVELKQMRLIDDLLGKRYNKIRMRKDQKQDRNNKIKQQRIELHKLIDSDLVYSLVKENAKKSVMLEKEKIKNEVINIKQMALMDNESSALLEKAKLKATEKNIPIAEAIKLIGKENTEIANNAIDVLMQNSNPELDKALDFSVLTETEPITKSNPIDMDLIKKQLAELPPMTEEEEAELKIQQPGLNNAT